MSSLKYFFLCVLIVNCTCYNITNKLCDRVKNERILPKFIGEEFNTYLENQNSDRSNLIVIIIIVVGIAMYIKLIGINNIIDVLLILLAICAIISILNHERKPIEKVTTFEHEQIPFINFMFWRKHTYIDVVEIDGYKIHGEFTYQYRYNYPSNEIIIYDENDTIIFQGVVDCHRRCFII